MARARKPEVDWEIDWKPAEDWRALQLTPEQKEALRARSQAKVDRARAEGVYTRFKNLEGKVRFTLSYLDMKDID